MHYLDPKIIGELLSQQLRNLPIRREDDTKYLP